MRCNVCGSEVNDALDYCDVCGAKLEKSTGNNSSGLRLKEETQSVDYYQREVQNQNPYQNQMPNYGNNPYMPQVPYNQPVYKPSPADYEMKWFKFVIYFQLFFTAVYQLISAYIISTGRHYINEYGNNVSDLVYEVFPGLQSLDTTMGVLMIVLAVYAIITRFMLSGYKKAGPPMYIVFYILGILISGYYLIRARSVASEVELDLTEYYVQVVYNIIIMALNIVYFNKRKELFVN